MPTFQFQEQLLSTPLFQGLSKSDLIEIIGNTRFGFMKVEEGRVLYKANDPCKQLTILLSGQLEITTQSAGKAFKVVEYQSAPTLLQTERLFGLQQNYSSTYKTHTQCHFVTLAKSEVVRLYNTYEVFRINLINILASQLQREQSAKWHTHQGTLEEKVISFFAEHCLHPAGEKHYYIKMKDLGMELNTNRLEISKAINSLQCKGLLTHTRGCVHVSALEKFFGAN